MKVLLLPGCITEGDTLGEALVNIREAIELYLASLAAAREPAPEEPMSAAVLERALAQARETIPECTEELREDGKKLRELPEPEVAAVDIAQKAPLGA